MRRATGDGPPAGLTRNPPGRAQTFLLLLGGGGGRAAGLAAVAAELARVGVSAPGDAFYQHDGSGLSRRNLVSTSTLVRVLLAMLGQEGGFASILPENCRTGSTLARRLCGLRPGAVRAKDGTMTGVSALSGYLLDREGAALGVFSVIVNNSELPEPARVAVIDEIVALVSARLVPPPPPPPP